MPRTTGKTISRNSSTRSLQQRLDELRAAVDDDVAVLLRVGFAGLRRGRRRARSCSSTPGSVRVEETTYFGMVLNLSANSPSREGQASAKPS